MRTPDARLVWYAPIGSRSKTSIAGLGIMEGYTGYLVRATNDDMGDAPGLGTPGTIG